MDVKGFFKWLYSDSRKVGVYIGRAPHREVTLIKGSEGPSGEPSAQEESREEVKYT